MPFPGDLRERFLATPLVTRHLIASTWIAVVLNVVVGLDDLVCASPHDIVRGGQLWRLALSLFYVPGALNALIVSFVLYRLAAAWERERGSIRLAYYFFVAVVSTNLGVCVLAVVVAPVVPSVLSPSFLCGPGILAAFLVLITRSSQAYGGANVSVLGAFQIPSRAFPLLLLAFFSVFGANPLESAASVAVGYAWALGCLDATMPGDRTLETVERHACVAPVANARGYVGVANAGPGLPIQMAPGSGAGAAGGGGSASGGAAADPASGFFAHIRDRAFAGEARGRGRRLDERGGGGGGGSGSGAGAGEGYATPPPLRGGDSLPPDVVAAAAAAPLPAHIRGGRGGAGGAGGMSSGGRPGVEGGGAGAGAGADAVSGEQTREARAEAFARAHEARLAQERRERDRGA